MAKVQVRAAVFFSALLFFASVLPLPPSYANEQNGALELARNHASTREELLLFYEEKDLIVATKRPTSLKKAPAIATVVTAEEIRNMGARNLMDVLKTVPGFGVTISELPTKRAIEVRGIRTKNSEKVLFMIDGHRMNNHIMGEAVNVLDTLSVESIKRVEVIRGPGSALYGANAFMAVINIVTVEAEDLVRDGSSGAQLTAGAGSFATQHYNVLVGHAGDMFKATAFGDYLDTDGPRYRIEADAQTLNDAAQGTQASHAPGETSEWERKQEAGFNAAYGNVVARGRVIDKRRGPYIGVGYALNHESVEDFSQYALDLIYTKQATDAMGFDLRLYADQFNLDYYWQIFPDGFGGIFSDGLLGSPRTKNRTLGSEFVTNREIGVHALTVGAMYERAAQFDTKHMANFNPNTFAPLGSFQDVSDGGNWNKDVHRDISALFVQDVWKLGEGASLTAGARYDDYSDFGGTLNPRLGFVWEAAADLSVKALYGSAFRAPTFTELYTVNNPAEAGNPSLKPETIRTYEAGLEYRFLRSFTARVNYFNSDIRNLIALGPKPSATEPAPYVNSRRAGVQGVETELFFSLGSGRYGYVNYAYQDPRDEATGARLPDVPSNRANAGINCQAWKYLSTHVNLSWIGERPRAEGDGRESLPSETTVDLTVIGRGMAGGLEMRGSVYNVFDAPYRDPSPYPVKVSPDYPANGRMFLAELRYAF